MHLRNARNTNIFTSGMILYRIWKQCLLKIIIANEIILDDPIIVPEVKSYDKAGT